MARKEEILEAARDYVSSISLSSPSNVIHFEAGAKWADEHLNLKSLWYDASEEPEEKYKIICQDEFENIWLTNYSEDKKHYENGWKECAECECIARWAYIKDLLPKN